ncbi:MAG: nitroreductase family protein [Flavobacteriales bacterium]
MQKVDFKPYVYDTYSEQESIERSRSFYELMNGRRSIREFSSRSVPKEVIENIIKTAGTAPSGAHKEPWTFCAVSNQELKTRIREMVEKEEYTNYHGRMGEEWLDDLKKFKTDHIKPFIENAPYLIIVFKRTYEQEEEGGRKKNYYVNESVGIAVGMMLSAVHNAGLVALTHTPSPMNFLERALDRPKNERAYLNIPVGYPAEGAEVPDIQRKTLGEIAKFFE